MNYRKSRNTHNYYLAFHYTDTTTMALQLPEEIWESIFSYIGVEDSLSFLSFVPFRKYILNNIQEIYIGGSDAFAGNSVYLSDVHKLCNYFTSSELNNLHLKQLSIKSIKQYLQISQLVPDLLTNSQKVDLNLQKIKYLPNLPRNLSKLSCQTNSVVNLKSFKKLNDVKVKNCSINSLPKNLTKLNIQSSRLLKSAEFADSINSLIISDCNFKNSWNLPNLTYISLNNCSIDVINYLPQGLVHLDLSNNSISSLNNITFPNTLTYLNLSNNNIDQIHRQNFSTTLHLDYLNLSNNPINEITPMSFLPSSINKLIINHEIQKINLVSEVVNLSVHVSSLNGKKFKIPDTIQNLNLTQLYNQFVTNDRYALPLNLSSLNLNGICFDGRLMKDFIPDSLRKITFRNCSIFNFNPNNISLIEFVNCKIETVVNFSENVKVVKVIDTALNKLNLNLQIPVYTN